MPVESTIYIVGKNRWTGAKSGGSGKAKKAAQHGERQAYRLVKQHNGPFFITQNAYPCRGDNVNEPGCHEFFLREAKNRGTLFIIHVTEDHSEYKDGHPLRKGFPEYIYYFNGACIYSKDYARQEGWPVIPDKAP